MHRSIKGRLASATTQTGVALIPLILTIAIAGALMGAGMKLVGPQVQRLRTASAISMLEKASRSVVAWSQTHGRLPTAAEFGAAAGVHDDPWKKGLVYVYDVDLTGIDTGGVCGRETTGLTIGGIADAAFAIISGGGDFTIDTNPSTSGAYAGNVTLSASDLSLRVSLADLHNRVGCFDRTTGRLILLNNELPEGCDGQPYIGDLFAEGGAAPYSWAGTTVPAWLTITPTGSSCHLSGSPPAPGTYPFALSLGDAAGAQSRRRFTITVAACTTGPAPVSQWDFNEGAGSMTSDGAGSNNGTLTGDTAWSSDTPDGSGASLVFDGSGDSVFVSDSASLHITGEVTLMAWAKETAIGQYAKIISRRTGYYFYFLGVDNGHPYGGIGDDITYTVTGKSLLMSLDHWNHLSVVYNDAADRMFLHFDGTERMTVVPESLPAIVGVDLSIGADSQGAEHFFDGDIDDVAIFDRALTDSEIRGLFYGTAHPNRVAGWGFNGTTGDAGTGAHDGIMVGGSYTSDRFDLPDAALRVDGSDCVRIPDHADFRLTGQLTLTAWIRERSSRAFAKVISRRTGNYFYFLGVDNGRPYAGIGDGSSYTVTRKSIAMIPDQWHFVAMVYDDVADRLQIYFDGGLDDTTVTVSLPDVPDVDLTIGADYQGTQNFFTGLIDQVAVYDQALSVEEIREAY
ncbi:uncharacterized protein Dvar_24400 [Desulfosarcina variabilis str. Montpellier]|uniref:LamG-like jellyroll fold domain-containing protein n=1 Tax=Desulfosarcina variabilis TaxID=2300 RepID=UPI003AFB53CB